MLRTLRMKPKMRRTKGGQFRAPAAKSIRESGNSERDMFRRTLSGGEKAHRGVTQSDNATRGLRGPSRG